MNMLFKSILSIIFMLERRGAETQSFFALLTRIQFNDVKHLTEFFKKKFLSAISFLRYIFHASDLIPLSKGVRKVSNPDLHNYRIRPIQVALLLHFLFCGFTFYIKKSLKLKSIHLVSKGVRNNSFSTGNFGQIFKYGTFLKFTLFALLITACEENKPIIPPLGEVEIQAAERKVLIEEFTGVRCVNCPQGSEEVENLLAIYGDNLIAVGIHAGSFSRPYNDSNMDFRTESGDQIINFLGVPLGYPSAVINRTDEDGNGRLQTGQSTWAGLIQQELDKITNVNLSINNSFQSTNNQLITNISITPTEDVSGDLRLSVMLVETNIADKQLTPEGEKDDYIHRHNLRHMLTNATGDAMTEPLTKGNTIEENFTFTIPDDWKVEDVSVIAFVHRSGDTKEVLQVEEVKILE